MEPVTISSYFSNFIFSRGYVLNKHLFMALLPKEMIYRIRRRRREVIFRGSEKHVTIAEITS